MGKRISLGILVSPMELQELVRDELARAMPARMAAVWQEQHPQESIPRVSKGIPATLTINVDVRVMNDLVTDLAAVVARKLEGLLVEREP